MWQTTTTYLLALLNAAMRGPGAGAAGPLYQAWVGLFQQGTATPNQGTTLANIVEANYHGYSRQQLTWFPPWIGSAGVVQMAAQDLLFASNDNLSSNLITGVFLASAFYGGTYWMGALLPPPGVFLGNPSQALKVQPVYSQPWTLVYGSPQLLS